MKINLFIYFLTSDIASKNKNIPKERNKNSKILLSKNKYLLLET